MEAFRLPVFSLPEEIGWFVIPGIYGARLPKAHDASVLQMPWKQKLDNCSGADYEIAARHTVSFIFCLLLIPDCNVKTLLPKEVSLGFFDFL